MIRAFIAIELPEVIQKKLDGTIGELISLKAVPIRWVKAKNIHLTIKFLGDSTTEQLHKIESLLGIIATQYRPFFLEVSGFGAFPNFHRARVVWVGIKAPPQLAILAREIDQTASQIGFPLENRPFSPHLTLGRVAENCTPEQSLGLGEVLAGFHPGVFGETQVDSLTLFKSDLQPGGSIYTPLFKTNFEP
jgi:RNA 2',3'-cyclic 3'-phosphodiesterase